jgi:HD-like signal output (HDOD) protein
LSLGFTYTDISADLLKIWQLPEKIILPIRHFNAASSIEINKDVKILNLASRLALIDSHGDKFLYEDVIDESLCRPLGLSVDDLEQAADFAEKEATSILSIMNPKLFSK